MKFGFDRLNGFSGKDVKVCGQWTDDDNDGWITEPACTISSVMILKITDKLKISHNIFIIL